MKKSQVFLCCVYVLILNFVVVSIGFAVEAASGDIVQPVKGKVMETMNSGGYTYVLVETAQGGVWAAIPETSVEMGREVTLMPGAVMNDFSSKTMNRTFKSIVFAGGLIGPNAESAAPKDAKNIEGQQAGISFSDALKAEGGGSSAHGHGSSMMSGGSMHGGSSSPSLQTPSGGSMGNIVPALEIKVEKATGDNAYTVGEIYAKGKELDGKKVKISGKVVKMSPMIMGKNWFHIQDGTGEAVKNTHDLVVTTMATAAKGSVVVVEGVLHADRDFGFGYHYDVIVEDAEVK
ncbi:MAG: DNA-binding protein [Desulfobulbaceae bacterium]|nr:DNA-binding protein [Desulfobulbaceae bacterium]